MRVISLALAVLLLSSCSGCNFADMFDIFIPNGTDENGNPITPDGSYTNSDVQSGSVHETEPFLEPPTEEPTDALITLRREILSDYWDQFKKTEQSPYLGDYEVQFLGEFGDAYAIYVVDTGIRGKLGVYYVDGYEFRHKRDNSPYLYEDGEFIALADAYENGLITQDDLGKIHEKFMSLNASDYKFIYQYDDRFGMDFNVVRVKIQPLYNSKEYTVEDFAEIGCTEVKESEYYGQEGEAHELYRTINVYFPGESAEDVVAAIRTLEKREDVYAAMPNSYFGTDSYPNDPEYSATAGDYWAAEKIDLLDAWEFETGSDTILIGVIDRGVDGTHPDLQGHINTALSKCFVSNCTCTNGLTDIVGHGTEVAGIIGAQTGNAAGVFGICQNVQIVSLKVAYGSENITADTLTAAIQYAKDIGIDILNYSGSGGSYDADVRNAIDNFPGLLVCTAGNTESGGVDIDETANHVYPACFNLDNILVVGASTPSDSVEDHSNYGADYVDLFAPGVDILTTYPIAICQSSDCRGDHPTYSNGYHHFQHTSAAAPFVSGVAALVLAQNPTFTAEQIKARILGAVDEFIEFNGDCVTGGRLNALKAVHTSHNYTYSYYLYSSTSHCAYCECGAYIIQRHTHSTRCTKCGYSGGLVPTPGITSKEDEEETE